MRIFHLTALLSTALVLYFTGGCYWDRLTWQYKDVEELDGKAQAVLAETSLTPEEEQKRIEKLEKFENEANRPYAINAGDSLSIVVYNHDDLSTRTVVTPDGYVGMVLVGQIKISGMTLADAAKTIEKALSKYIRNPKVGISPTVISSETVTILGAVNKWVTTGPWAGSASRWRAVWPSACTTIRCSTRRIWKNPFSCAATRSYRWISIWRSSRG